MKTLQLILALIFVWQVSATSYLENTKRAEFFEQTDDEIPIFRITMPEKNVKQLKEDCQAPPIAFRQIAEDLMANFFGNSTKTVEDLEEATKFKDNVELEIELKGKKTTFKKVTFAVGGSSARRYGRQGFNIKIRGKEKFLGRSQFRLRSDNRDATFLRSKLACDMHNRLGLPSISANFASLYVNGEYLGFYVVMESPKLPWIEENYGEKDTQNLIKCKIGGNYLTYDTCAFKCENENEDVTDNTEWFNILKTLDSAKSAEDIEDVFDVDQFLYETAFELLVGAWDHMLTSGHNYSVYKQKNGKWVVIYYDFDGDFGQDIIGIEFAKPFVNPNKDYPSYTFEQWFQAPVPLLNVLVTSNPARFEKILKKVIEEAFNPEVLFPHIDSLKKLIRSEIVRIRTPDENGKLPGVLNNLKPYDYSIEEWEANTEFTSINNEKVGGSAYGLKYWILSKYRNICKQYNLECDPVYMDEDYEYPIDKTVEGEIDTHAWDGIDFGPMYGLPPKDQMGQPPVEIPEPIETPEPTEVPEPTETEVPEPTETKLPEEPQKEKCIAELIGYPCCPKNVKAVYQRDEYGEWGYDFKNKTWCGLTPIGEDVNGGEECWSEVYGYPCCYSCVVVESDDDGQWGYENGQWCGIQSYCS